MTTPHQRDSAALHARLGHPVVDADGHYLELMPVMLDYLEQIGGQRVVEGFKLFGSRVTRSLTSSLEERRKHRVAMEAFWAWLRLGGHSCQGHPRNFLSPVLTFIAFPCSVAFSRATERQEPRVQRCLKVAPGRR
jgi:hypothetical protein